MVPRAVSPDRPPRHRDTETQRHTETDREDVRLIPQREIPEALFKRVSFLLV